MKRLIRSAALAVAVALVAPSAARAEEKLNGVLTKLDVAADKQSAVAILKDDQTAALVPITIVDKGTLDKFERNVISVNDEIKCRYEKRGKKNVAVSFKRAAGCS